MKTRCVFSIVLSVLLLAITAEAQFPRTISYQGVLCDATGQPKPDGSYMLTFRLYDTQTGGTPLWTEQKSLTTKRGLLSTQLGDQVLFGPNLTFDRQYWLGLQVAAETELSPRIPLSSVGNSFRAWAADTAAVATTVLDRSVTTAKLGDGAVTSGKIMTGNVVKSINTLKDSVTLKEGSNITISQSGNTITFSAASGQTGPWQTSGSNVYYNSGNVGIGTTSPVEKLEVSGNVKAMSFIGSGSGLTFTAAQTFSASNSTQVVNVSQNGTGAGLVVSSSSAGTGNFPSGMAIYGAATNPSGAAGVVGVLGSPTSVPSAGVAGATNTTSSAVEGRHTATTGTGAGVTGTSASSSGIGVQGLVTGMNASAGVFHNIAGGKILSGLAGPGGTEVFTVQGNGNVGIGSSSPAAKLHVADGSLLLSGSTGGTPASGAGTRVMWIPTKGSFRAGHAVESEWDDANIGLWSTAMGWSTTASANSSTATGGYTLASGDFSTAMGSTTEASGHSSTAIGNATKAFGFASTAMGSAAVASGNNSTAIGTRVSTNNHAGSFIVGDNSSTIYTDNDNDNEFKAVFAGGYQLLTTRASTAGVYMNGGTSGWTNISDRNKKENFLPIDGEELLLKIRCLSITEWNYKNSDRSIKYIGPVAQDFYAAFHLGGSDSLGINSICIDGVNMAAIQALEKRTAELQKKTAELEALKSELAEVKARLIRLEAALVMQKGITERLPSDPAENGGRR